jgi:DNA-binding protein HU-beta
MFGIGKKNGNKTEKKNSTAQAKENKKKEIARILDKRQSIERMAKKLRMTQKVVEEVYDEIVGFTLNELSKVGAVRLSGFGTFRKKIRKEREAINPRTLERVKIGATPYIRFVPGTDALDAIGSKPASKRKGKK